jgi:hypothetical protein
VTRIQLPGGSVVEVTDLPDGAKRIGMSCPYGMGQLTLDKFSAREVALALAPHPEEPE